MALFKKRDADDEERGFEADWAAAEADESSDDPFDEPRGAHAAAGDGAGEAADGADGADVPDDAPDDDAPADAPEVGARASYDFAEGEGDFPEPHELAVDVADEPAFDGLGDQVSGLPFDEEGALEPNADAEEYLPDAEGFADDAQTDYYQYGDKMHGVRDMPPAPQGAVVPAGTSGQAAGQALGKHGRQRPTRKELEEAMPEHMRHSRRSRKLLIVVVVLLAALLVAFGVLSAQMVRTSQDVAAQQASQAVTDAQQVQANVGALDTSADNQKITSVPQLVSVLGYELDESVSRLGSGAIVTGATPAGGTGNQVVESATVLLTDEPADMRIGTPTVYLGTNADGTVIQAGYSAATASLGYGTLSFSDAVVNEHVIEKTLNEAGLNVASGSVELPDKDEYSTYASDGDTLLSEKCSFEGASTVNDIEYRWWAVLSYDYAASNVSGNLQDTIRQITVYVSPAELPEVTAKPADAAKPAGGDAAAQGDTAAAPAQDAAAPADQPAAAQGEAS